MKGTVFKRIKAIKQANCVKEAVKSIENKISWATVNKQQLILFKPNQSQLGEDKVRRPDGPGSHHYTVRHHLNIKIDFIQYRWTGYQTCIHRQYRTGPGQVPLSFTDLAGVAVGYLSPAASAGGAQPVYRELGGGIRGWGLGYCTLSLH